ncbi:MAG: hypothetical protein M9959_14110 [Chitinophagaceae bacterium]|nr:hypothetical protein [Chitinophagaceae bacterium]
MISLPFLQGAPWCKAFFFQSASFNPLILLTCKTKYLSPVQPGFQARIYVIGLFERFQVIGMDKLVTGDLEKYRTFISLKEFEFYHHDVTKFIHIPGNLDYILAFASCFPN